MSYSRTTPLAAITRGILAGAVGTAMMGAAQKLEQKLGGGSEGSESSGEPQDWSDQPAPAQVGQRVVEGVFQRHVGLDKANLLMNVVHWGYGSGLGAIYGIAQSSARPNPAAHGALFGTGVWLNQYAALPAMKIYEPIWKYPPKTLAIDLARHLVYGLGVAGAYRALGPLFR